MTRCFLLWQALLWPRNSFTVTARATVTFIKELKAGDLIQVDGQLSRLGSKSVTFHLRMLNEVTNELHATHELVEVFFDPKTRQSSPIPDSVRRRLEQHLHRG